MAYSTIAPIAHTVKIHLDTHLKTLQDALKKDIANPTERTRLELAIKDISRAKKTLNLIVCDSRI